MVVAQDPLADAEDQRPVPPDQGRERLLLPVRHVPLEQGPVGQVGRDRLTRGPGRRGRIGPRGAGGSVEPGAGVGIDGDLPAGRGLGVGGPAGLGEGVCGEWHFVDPVTEEFRVRIRTEEGCVSVIPVMAGEGMAIGNEPCEFHREEDFFKSPDE